VELYRSLTLITLDISYNHIVELPPQIGDLVLLKYVKCYPHWRCPVAYVTLIFRELRASFNKLASIPPDFGRLKRLRKLVLNGNRITAIPDELGRLDSLEELILSENSIEEIPMSIAQMGSLRVLKLQNNKLTKLPSEIAELLTLEVLDCSGNKKLDMIPPMWLGDTEGILFILRIHRGNSCFMYYLWLTVIYIFLGRQIITL
jgi:hypothetical protein